MYYRQWDRIPLDSFHSRTTSTSKCSPSCQMVTDLLLNRRRVKLPIRLWWTVMKPAQCLQCLPWSLMVMTPTMQSGIQVVISRKDVEVLSDNWVYVINIFYVICVLSLIICQSNVLYRVKKQSSSLVCKLHKMFLVIYLLNFYKISD